MKLKHWNNYVALLAAVGLIALAGGPASAQSWNGASPFIVGSADHGIADRPSGDFNFMEGAASDGSIHGPSLHSHMAMSSKTLEEISAVLGLGLLGLSEMNSGHDSAPGVSQFASVLPPTGYSTSSGLGSGASGSGSRPTTAPVPEFGTGASFGIMAMLGVAGMGLSRRKRHQVA